MRIFAIETSCDETSFALLQVTKSGFDLQQHLVASQINIHKKYGGVVPEVAARKHLEVLLPLLDKSIGLKAVREADLLTVTRGPGLITSLMVGTETAKSLAYSLNKPLVGINHLEAHIYANWLTYPELFKNDKKIFPALVLIVSGGHTELVLMKGHGKYQLIGQTLDDAAGEAFDKVAKILDLGYPGGPIVAKLASEGNPAAIDFPRPMIDKDNFNFSFAGLKTAVLYYVQKQEASRKKLGKNTVNDICASFQLAACDVLIKKMERAAKQYKVKSLMVVGGVSANKELGIRCRAVGTTLGLSVLIPAVEFTGDNAAMIAAAAYYHRKDKGLKENWKKLRFDPQLRLT
ncbi:MAG: tRNA (adenosine(37)-N6)-threonylcarbamoyltransferase complex transferase subunit TsaD [Candidatus Komeilibacteria bacterium]